MNGITRRLAIPFGLAVLAPESSRAGGRCKKQRNNHTRNNQQQNNGQAGCGQCTPDRNAIYVTIANFLEDENAIQVTLTPVAGNPQSFTPEAFARALAVSIAENGAPICDQG